MFHHLEENVARVLGMEQSCDMSDMMDIQQESQQTARYSLINFLFLT